MRDTTIEEFLLEVLTLRSNPVYRQDIDTLEKYEKVRPAQDWVKEAGLNDPIYAAARNLIGTWDLICRLLTKRFPDEAPKPLEQSNGVVEFVTYTPVAHMYAKLHGALKRLSDERAAQLSTTPGSVLNGKPYAESFEKIGKIACKLMTGMPLPPANTAAPSVDAYFKTAELTNGAQTHFG